MTIKVMNNRMCRSSYRRSWCRSVDFRFRFVQFLSRSLLLCKHQEVSTVSVRTSYCQFYSRISFLLFFFAARSWFVATGVESSVVFIFFFGGLLGSGVETTSGNSALRSLTTPLSSSSFTFFFFFRFGGLFSLEELSSCSQFIFFFFFGVWSSGVGSGLRLLVGSG